MLTTGMIQVKRIKKWEEKCIKILISYERIHVGTSKNSLSEDSFMYFYGIFCEASALCS